MASYGNDHFKQAFTQIYVQEFLGTKRLSPQIKALLEIGAIDRAVLVEHSVAKDRGGEVTSSVGFDVTVGDKVTEVKNRTVVKCLNGGTDKFSFNLTNSDLKAKTADFVIVVDNPYDSSTTTFDVPLSTLRRWNKGNTSGLCFAWSKRNGWNRLQSYITKKVAVQFAN